MDEGFDVFEVFGKVDESLKGRSNGDGIFSTGNSDDGLDLATEVDLFMVVDGAVRREGNTLRGVVLPEGTGRWGMVDVLLENGEQVWVYFFPEEGGRGRTIGEKAGKTASVTVLWLIKEELPWFCWNKDPGRFVVFVCHIKSKITGKKAMGEMNNRL